MVKNSYKMIPLSEPKITSTDIKYVSNQLRSNFFGPGKTNEKFAKKLAKVTNRKYAITLSSGTIALTIAALALGLKKNDEIIIPCYGVFSVINAFAAIGLNIKLCDINPENGSMDATELEKIISKKTKAVCFISFLGNIGEDLNRVESICKKNKILLIHDGAWCLGRKIKKKIGCSQGDISITSFSVPKIVTTGQGGAIMTNSPNIRNKVMGLIDQGDKDWRKKNNINSIGSNLRFSDLNASFGLSQLSRINLSHKIRRKNFKLLNKLLNNRLIKTLDNDYSFQNVLLVNEKKKIIKYLRNKGIMATNQYNLYSKLNVFKKRYKKLKFPGGELWASKAVYLPFGISMSKKSITYIANQVNQSLKKIL